MCQGDIWGAEIWPFTWPGGAENSLAFTYIKSECAGHPPGGGGEAEGFS